MPGERLDEFACGSVPQMNFFPNTTGKRCAIRAECDAIDTTSLRLERSEEFARSSVPQPNVEKVRAGNHCAIRAECDAIDYSKLSVERVQEFAGSSVPQADGNGPNPHLRQCVRQG